MCRIMNAAYFSHVDNLKFSRFQKFTEILNLNITDFKDVFQMGKYLENTD